MTFINVAPDKYLNGIKSLHGPHIDRNGERFQPLGQWKTEITEALHTSYECDAHFVCYDISGEDQIPLLTKAAIPSIRESGKEVVLTAIALDWDTPAHVPLTSALLGEFLASFYKACALDTTLGSWYCWYTSRHGCRVVYRLKEPVPVDQGEQYIATVITDFKKNGVKFDEKCRDWTRRFRLPKVVRDGVPTESESFSMEFQEATLDLTGVRKTSTKTLAIRKTFTRRDSYPRMEEIDKKLFKRGTNGGLIQSEFTAKAKKLFKGSPLHDTLFNPDAPFCVHGSRNDTIMEVIGTITPRLIRTCSATVEEVFALVYGPICQLEPDAGTPDWHYHAWNALQDIYAREIDKYNTEKEIEADKEIRVQDTLASIAQAMKIWCDAPELRDTEDRAKEFVKKHAFACFGKFFYPIQEDGSYAKNCITKEQLIPWIRKSFMDDIIETEKTSVQGDLIDVPVTQIINEYTTIVQRVVYKPQQDVRGYITDMNGSNPEIVLPMYRRNPYLLPKYDPYVDGWLHAFFPNYDLGAKWIAYSLAFEEGPICALSIQGPSKTGKKMFTIGLAECLENYAYSTGETIASSFNGALMTSPFLFVNEGWPKMRGRKSPSDTIKSMTAGDDIEVRDLYKPSVLVQNPMRVIFTANDHDLLHELTKDKSMAPDNRDALGERILHFDIGNVASNYLNELGNNAFTARDGNRWIRGDGGTNSDYVVARHFLWLYENREKKWPRLPSDRYCVMGNCTGTNNMMFEMITQNDNTTKVIRAIIGMAESKSSVWGRFMIVDEKASIYVTEAGLKEYIFTVMNDTIGDRQLSDVLKNVVRNNSPFTKAFKYFYEIELDTVLKYAMMKGIDANIIRGYRAKQLEAEGV